MGGGQKPEHPDWDKESQVKTSKDQHVLAGPTWRFCSLGVRRRGGTQGRASWSLMWLPIARRRIAESPMGGEEGVSIK